MDYERRQTIQRLTVIGLAISSGLLSTGNVAAVEWQAGLFDLKNMDDILKNLGGNFAPSTEISINAPEIAENGAVVPISVTSSVLGTEKIAILVEKNPNPLSTRVTIPVGTEPSITTRVKMAGTSNVHALVQANGKWLIATKEIKVTLGGCGG
jgi:sulfur-oxidizing protein SoxY